MWKLTNTLLWIDERILVDSKTVNADEPLLAQT
jgi:hypothetical protein